MGGGLPLGSCFLLSGLLARMGGPRPTSWAPIGIPSCFLSELLGRMGGPWPKLPLGSLYVSFFLGPGSGSLHIAFLGSWVGWVGRGPEAGLPFGSLHVSFFLGSWVGGPRPRSWARVALPLSFLGSWADGWAAAKSWAPFMFPFWGVGSDGCAALCRSQGARRPSCFLSPGLSQGWAPLASLRSQGCSHH